MPKYKVGDVAALFPNPPKPKTESGKKIQALFSDFYNKPSNPSKKWKDQNQFEGKEKQVEDNNASVVEKEPKKKKRKFQNSNISNSAEITDVQVAKKLKLETTAAQAPFPRNKSRRDRNSNRGSYIPKEIANEVDFGEESFPKRKSQMTLEQESPSFPKKKNKKKASQNDSTVPGEGPPPTEESDHKSDFPNSKTQPEELSGKKKKKSPKNKSVVPDAGLPEFLKLKPNEAQANSKVAFRMKKQREIPSCKEIFEKYEPSKELAGGKQSSVARKATPSFKEKTEETEERLSRTLFVGNLPVSTTKKSLEKLFSPFGSLENSRLRGAMPMRSTIPRKIAERKQKYHSALQSRIAYVVLKDMKSAISALSLSGIQIDGHHIVVDRASASGEKKVYDKKRSIFVGNLPFAITDEMLWAAFLPCGDIEAVRVIRDKETGVGKGFGYISFQKLQGKEKALALPKMEIDGRRLRIQGAGGEKKKRRQAPSSWKGAMRRIAKKKQDGNLNSRKTLKKLMNRGKRQHQKKKIAGIFKKFS